MHPEQQDLLNQIKQDGQLLKKIVQEDVSFDKMKLALGHMKDCFEQVKPHVHEGEGGDQLYEEWRQVRHHLIRASRMLELKAPRLVLEYEIKWLILKLAHFEQRLKGEQPQITLEEKQLKGSDLFNL
ncbi:hypothetical protein PU629_02005 [Pullulanibacillus sp. KACC 23026]|uniref:hypothetical protein n=1 Tax=Pullulanibacillus sp. KACC 23026 TaxID=3028315 RepID=UPI0023B1A92D|nr:hypothetical protein [Pullulanibacillus sp. KACC 23026]WEG13158.1 hypothetical protein PU629_02005 [Pullulanibacillus sp. KACC 23026]